jgi:hypothetical protein
VAGGLVPGFIAQYRQRLGGRLDQARLDLQAWQSLADRLYGGDLDKLIQYHMSSTDPTVHAEGGIIQSLVNAVQNLQSAVDALHGNLYHQLAYLSLHADPALVRATSHDWVPTFALSGEGLLFAAVAGVAVWLLFEALWALLAFTADHLAGRHKIPGSDYRPKVRY